MGSYLDREASERLSQEFRRVFIEALASWPVPLREWLRQVGVWHGIHEQFASDLLQSLGRDHRSPIAYSFDHGFYLTEAAQKELNWRGRVERANRALRRLDSTPFARSLERSGIDLPDRLVPMQWVAVGRMPTGSSHARTPDSVPVPAEARNFFRLEPFDTGSPFDTDKSSWRLLPGRGVSVWHIAWLQTPFDQTQLLCVENRGRQSLLSVAWERDAALIRLRPL